MNAIKDTTIDYMHPNNILNKLEKIQEKLNSTINECKILEFTLNQKTDNLLELLFRKIKIDYFMYRCLSSKTLSLGEEPVRFRQEIESILKEYKPEMLETEIGPMAFINEVDRVLSELEKINNRPEQ